MLYPYPMQAHTPMTLALMPPAEELRKLLHYVEDGTFVWLPRGPDMFTRTAVSAKQPDMELARKWAAKRWNAQYALRTVKPAVDDVGRKRMTLFGQSHFVAHVVWVWHTGALPTHQIDHIDGDPGNDRIENLRDVPQVDNMRNTRLHKSSHSGAPGVYWDRNKWKAVIHDDGKPVQLGRFTDLSAAVKARKAAEIARGYHLNHGRVPAGFVPKPIPVEPPRPPRPRGRPRTVVHDPLAVRCNCVECRKARSMAPPPVGRKWLQHDPTVRKCMCAECKVRRRTQNPVTKHKGRCTCAACERTRATPRTTTGTAE